MAGVIVETLKSCPPDSPTDNWKLVARNHQDNYGRSEYLTIDVTAYDDATWGPIVWAVEHENDPSLEKIENCAWKLLNLRAPCKVLIANHNHPCRESSSHQEIADELLKLVTANPGQQLLFISGNWKQKATDDQDWTELFEITPLQA